MAAPRPTPQTAIHRVHRADRSICARRLCRRRHWHRADCLCGWTETYSSRQAARRMLNDFHLEDDHGGADD